MQCCQTSCWRCIGCDGACLEPRHLIQVELFSSDAAQDLCEPSSTRCGSGSPRARCWDAHRSDAVAIDRAAAVRAARGPKADPLHDAFVVEGVRAEVQDDGIVARGDGLATDRAVREDLPWPYPWHRPTSEARPGRRGRGLTRATTAASSLPPRPPRRRRTQQEGRQSEAPRQ